MKRFFIWRSEWVYGISIAFLYGAIVLRTILLAYPTPNILIPALLMLAAWLLLFLIEPAVSRRWSGYFIPYLVVQTALTFILMLNPEPSDFFATMYAMLGMQIMQRYSTRTGTILIAIFLPLTFFPIVRNIGVPAGAALTLTYTAANALLAAYALAARGAAKIRTQNEATRQELQDANLQLATYSKQIERLTVARERGRLARELHDSVTQSIFSMTLTTQSALLLLDRDPRRVGEQLSRLNELAQGALEEMQTLISELNPQTVTQGGLADALRRHLSDRHLPEGLSVSLEVTGEDNLPPAEEQGLFRIAQEGLNNIVKHASASQASLKLHLDEPGWMEIEDNGQGFDLEQAKQGRGVGLSSMRERAAEIGWELKVTSTPGSGTRVHLEKAGAKSKPTSSTGESESPIPNTQSLPPEKEGKA